MDLDLLKKISELPGAPGFEHRIRDFIIDQINDHVDEYEVDGIGNLIVRINGGQRRVMAAAHLDEISLISKYIDDNGFIRFHNLGGFDPKTLSTQRVIVHGKKDLLGVIGTKGIHAQSAEERKKAADLKDFFIDVGLPPEKVKQFVPNGSPITREKDLRELGDKITGKSLDNRISVYILLEAIRQAKNTQCDFYGVFTVQEEVGIRGARVAANHIQPEIGIALDTTLANDTPGIEAQDKCTELGKGAAIKIYDSSVISTPSLVTFLEKLCDANNIKYQREILTAGGTDSSGIQYLTGVGAYTSCISTPTRYIHSTVETVSKADVNAAIQLAIKTIENIHTYTP
jgi:putative aminopeptidase FrvX